ncbi:MAG: DEAD/DEAH box helicase [Promethearchaeota archaeon]
MARPAPRTGRDVDSFLNSLREAQSGAGEGGIVHVRRFPARPPRYGKLAAKLHPKLANLLKSRGIRLWLHQTGAINRLLYPRAKLNVVVTTPTASGKSLCYNVPVLDRLLRDPEATALYVFPRKALARDQLREFQDLAEGVGLPPHAAGVYTRDTPQAAKRRIREHARVVLTTAHGLSYYLSHRQLWRRIWSKLAFVVLDEAHVFTGVFGSNAAMVVRRLRRLVDEAGGSPQFVLCSATIANPVELAEKLVGLPFDLVDKDGSASGERTFLVWLPPEREEGQRREGASPHQAARKLFVAHVAAGFQTLMFVTSRKMAELQAKWAKESLRKDGAAALADRVWCYRAGLRPQDRRRIERQLKDGTIRGVVSTNALELGIDVGSLDATILSGFPGSVASFWQQAGRAGRKADSTAISTFVPFEDALDQFYAQNPDALFGKPHENAIVSLDNPYIFAAHVRCAARELPVTPERDVAYFGPRLVEACEGMVREGMMEQRGGKFYWLGPPDFPAGQVNLEAIPQADYEVVATLPDGGRLKLGTEGESRVLSEMHDGAVYLYLGDTFVVEELDLEAKRVVMRRRDVGYYTQSLRHTRVEVVNEEREATFLGGRLHAHHGTVDVTHHYYAYVRKAIYTGEVLERVPLEHLPATTFRTKATWFAFPAELVESLLEAGRDLAGTAHALEHATIAMTPHVVTCDRRDVGGVSTDLDPRYDAPSVFIYDGYPGGVGLTEKAFELLPRLFEVTRSMVESCGCDEDGGCPSCVMSPKCGNQNDPLDKRGALAALMWFLGRN